MSILIPTSKKESNKTMDSNFNGLPTLPSWFDDILGKGFTSEYLSNFNTGITLPKTNIRETVDAYFVEMAVPGLKKDDLELKLDNQMLSISAETKKENEENKDNYTRREFGYSSFKRSFILPEFIDESKIKAKYNEGILSIELPKMEEAKPKPPKTIKVS